MSPEAVAARVWRVRERTEHEAAALFDGLAADLRATGAPAQLAQLASRCADDEREHATLCRAVVEALEPGLAPLEPSLRETLGPPELSVGERCLYASVAVGCVTETLSTALLVAIRDHVTHPEARRAVRTIVKDEVRHSRLGWAHLAHAAGRGSVAWLGPHVAAMRQAALRAETAAPEGPEHDLRPFGILPAPEVERICRATLESTLEPGLRLHGIGAA